MSADKRPYSMFTIIVCEEWGKIILKLGYKMGVVWNTNKVPLHKWSYLCYIVLKSNFNLPFLFFIQGVHHKMAGHKVVTRGSLCGHLAKQGHWLNSQRVMAPRRPPKICWKQRMGLGEYMVCILAERSCYLSEITYVFHFQHVVTLHALWTGKKLLFCELALPVLLM